MAKRESDRRTRRLEVKFKSWRSTETYPGTTSDVSESGLFVRTRYGLIPGTFVEVQIYLPDGTMAKVQGQVKRTIKTGISTFKNGMGILITEKDQNYIKLMHGQIDRFEDENTAMNDLKTEKGSSEIPKTAPKAEQEIEYVIVVCKGCSVKNKVAKQKLSLSPRCGKCGITLKHAGMA
ncbi:MAG: PilZ domain-containing protein [Nitrospiraceae bacterium]|nr:PilZ domain-containing protein [Nitrospiraceae bacterium]